MNTNHVGDIAEQAVILRSLEFGWGVCWPIGNGLAYDLILDVNSTLVRVQVKSVWLDEVSGNFVTDNRRTKTNRRQMVRDNYGIRDFDFAVVYLPIIKVFYIIPVELFIEYGSSISFVENEKRQRRPRSAANRNCWQLIEKWAAQMETSVWTLVKFGEPFSDGNPEPSLKLESQDSGVQEGVET